jgi:hypothetical protein
MCSFPGGFTCQFLPRTEVRALKLVYERAC